MLYEGVHTLRTDAQIRQNTHFLYVDMNSVFDGVWHQELSTKSTTQDLLYTDDVTIYVSFVGKL